MDETQKRDAPVLGILRLDYDYPPAKGDIDHPDTFNYDVLYRSVPGLTFEICQSGDFSDEIKEHCINAVKFLNEKGVSGITGDCGFMVHLQDLVREHTDKPVFLSCLGQLPSILNSIARDAEIAIFTANSDSLGAMESELDKLCGLEDHSHRLQIVGCQNVPGFEAVAEGRKVDVEKVEPGVIHLTKAFLAAHPKVRCLLLECTELPPYANALRFETGLPVYDAITNCDAFMAGFQSDLNFGDHGWQKEWSGKHKDYHLGDNLTEEERNTLVTKPLG